MQLPQSECIAKHSWNRLKKPLISMHQSLLSFEPLQEVCCRKSHFLNCFMDQSNFNFLVGLTRPLDVHQDQHEIQGQKQQTTEAHSKPSKGQGRGSATEADEADTAAGPFGVPWFLWLFPLIAFLLGTWQVYRWEYVQISCAIATVD